MTKVSHKSLLVHCKSIQSEEVVFKCPNVNPTITLKFSIQTIPNKHSKPFLNEKRDSIIPIKQGPNKIYQERLSTGIGDNEEHSWRI